MTVPQPENHSNKAGNRARKGSQQGKRQQVPLVIGEFCSRFLFTIHQRNINYSSWTKLESRRSFQPQMPAEKNNTGVIVPFPYRELFPLGSLPKDRALAYRGL